MSSHPGNPGTKNRAWIAHLAIAAGIGAAVWVADRATGSHMAKALNSFAANLAVWYEDRRIPTVLCSPRTPVPYTQLEGVSFEVPQCWHAESTSLFDKQVHRFFDPDARAGVVSVSVDEIDGDADRQALQSEFRQLASRPTARVDDAPANDSAADSAAESSRRVHSAADSLAERFARESGGAAAGPSTNSAGGFHRIETVGVIGASDEPSPELSAPRFASRPSEGTGPRRAWSWLLVSDHVAVRVVYTVRDDWVGESAISSELKRVRAMVRSVKPSR